MTDHTQSFSIRKWSRLSFRFGCFRFFLCKLCGFRFAMGIIRVAHFFKLRLGHDKLVKLLSRRGKDRAVANVINARPRNIAQIFLYALIQHRNREHFALAAEQRRIIADAVDEIHLRSYGVIVALIGEKAAGRYVDMALMGKIIAGRMLAVALAVISVLHYGLHGGNLTVDKVFHAAGQRVVVKREAPDDNVRGNELFYAACHIVVFKALAGCALPAGKAALTGLYMEKEFNACSVMNGFPFLGRDQIEDVYDDEQIWFGLAKRCLGSPMVHSVCGPSEAYVKGIENIMNDYTIDIGIYAGHVGCKHAWAAGRMVTDVMEKKYGTPVLTFDLDSGDIRYKSTDEIKATITDFMETLAARGYDPAAERAKLLK